MIKIVPHLPYTVNSVAVDELYQQPWYSVVPIYRSIFAPNNSQETPIAHP